MALCRIRGQRLIISVTVKHPFSFTHLLDELIHIHPAVVQPLSQHSPHSGLAAAGHADNIQVYTLRDSMGSSSCEALPARLFYLGPKGPLLIVRASSESGSVPECAAGFLAVQAGNHTPHPASS